MCFLLSKGSASLSVVLYFVIYCASSAAGESNFFLKITPILDTFTKVAVIGLACSACLHTVVSSATHKKQEKYLDTLQDVCVPDEDNVFRVGQNNLTHCLEQHPNGDFVLMERVDFKKFSKEEKNKYPLCNVSDPFSGTFIMFPYSFDNFNITRNRTAAMFFSMEGATVKANFTNADVTGTIAALLAGSLQNNNTIDLRQDISSIKAIYRGEDDNSYSLGAVVAAYVFPDSVHSIALNIEQSCYLKSLRYAGSSVAYVSDNVMLVANIEVKKLFLECGSGRYDAKCGGAIGTVKNGYVAVSFNGAWVHMTESNNVYHSHTFLGAVWGENVANTYHLAALVFISNLTITGGNQSTGAVSIGYFDVVSLRTTQQPIIITDIHLNINTGTSAIGIANASVVSFEAIPSIYLLSASGTLNSASSHLLFPYGSCTTSMIDWSGVALNTKNLGCTGALELETLYSDDWRIAYEKCAAQLCKTDRNCVYPGERLIALVKEKGNRFFLITQQRYFQNKEADKRGLVRVTRYMWTRIVGVYNIQVDSAFALNGMRLFTNGTEALLPKQFPIATHLEDNYNLSLLYQEAGVTKWVVLPLGAPSDTVYTVSDIACDALPVQMESEALWLDLHGDLQFYNLSSAAIRSVAKNPFNDGSAIVGAQYYKPYLYVVYIQSHRMIIRRFAANRIVDPVWSAVFPAVDNYAYHQLEITGDSDVPDIIFLHVTELVRFDLQTLVKGEVPAYGGLVFWHYETTIRVSNRHMRKINHIERITGTSIVISIVMMSGITTLCLITAMECVKRACVTGVDS